MNRSSFALFVALLIHILLVIVFWFLGTISPDVKPVKKQEQRMKVSLKELPKTSKNSGLTKKIKPPKDNIAPPMPKGKQLKEMVKPQKRAVKKITKQKKIKYEPKKIKKQAKVKKKPINKPKTKPVVKKKISKVTSRPPEKPYIPLKEKKKEDPLAYLYEDHSAEEVKTKTQTTQSGSNISQNIKQLYGEEFGKLTPGQQQYIIDNQEIMRRITQQVLTRVARVNLPRDINVNRVNIIEFYLHPNGDMSDFKFLKKSGYYVLDDTTKETIEYAYSKYPLPKEKTLIRYNVFYNLAHH